MMTEFVKNSGARAATATSLMLAFALASCSKPARVDCQPSALVDTAGETGEKSRVEFQWLAIKVGLDSALRTPAGIAAHRAAEAGLDSAIGRYRDSMKLEGTGLVAKSGCIDWSATWTAGRFDHGAMVTAMLRALGKDSANAIEWNVASDSAASVPSVHAIYSLPGGDGGRIDSAVLRLDRVMVSVAPR